MKQIRSVTLLLALLMLTLPATAAPASAQAIPTQGSDTSLTCFEGRFNFLFTPPLWGVPSKGTMTPMPDASFMDCSGFLRGQPVMGTGTFSWIGHYGTSSPVGDTCMNQGGAGRYFLALPTLGGWRFDTGTFEQYASAWALGGGAFHARSDDGVTEYVGPLHFFPQDGRLCVTPVGETQARLAFCSTDAFRPTCAVPGRPPR